MVNVWIYCYIKKILNFGNQRRIGELKSLERKFVLDKFKIEIDFL